ncbi:MAG: hypothetical protein NC133_03950 [Prevotella sp.]|nr:hypothetical protein [Prevotella sp.]
MGFVSDYLSAPRYAQDIVKITGSSQPDDMEYTNTKMCGALLRWQQLFDNPFVDRQALNLKTPRLLDFARYRNDVFYLLSKRIDEEQFNQQVRSLLLLNVKQMMQGDENLSNRIVTLLTMGTCEYHGFNEVFTDSIRQHGLNPKAKFYRDAELQPIREILDRVEKSVGMSQRDQNTISVSPDPEVACFHAKISPEWFYFFSNGGNTINHGYLARDYACTRKYLFNFPYADELTTLERNQVTRFFDYWWKRLATPMKPKLAVMPMYRDRAKYEQQLDFNLQFAKQWGLQKTVELILNSNLYQNYENRYSEPIPPEMIQIIDIPTAQELSRRMEKIHQKLGDPTFLRQPPTKNTDQEHTM